LTSVIGVITVVFTSSTAGIGNSLIVETKEKNFNDLKKYFFDCLDSRILFDMFSMPLSVFYEGVGRRRTADAF
jgi:hypothetical protein